MMVPQGDCAFLHNFGWTRCVFICNLILLLWHHNGHDGVWNHQPHHCSLNRSFRRKSKKTSKLLVTGLCVVTGEFPAQMASNAENVSIWWGHHACGLYKIVDIMFQFKWLKGYIYSSCYYHYQIGSIHPPPLLSYISVVVYLRCLLHHIMSFIAYTFRENPVR